MEYQHFAKHGYKQTREKFLPLVEKRSLVPVCKAHLSRLEQSGLKAGAFSPGYLRTGINGPPRGPGHVLRLEDLWSRFVTQIGIKGSFGTKFVFSFLGFLYFLYFSIFPIFLYFSNI
jgi:hypothetical protein